MNAQRRSAQAFHATIRNMSSKRAPPTIAVPQHSKKRRSNEPGAEAAPNAIHGVRPCPDVTRELAKVLGRNATTMRRIRKTDDTPPRIGIYDVISAVTGLDGNHAGKTYRDLMQHHPEVHSTGVNFKFPGRGQRETPVTDAKGIVEIVMMLPGKRAATVRRQAAEILVRYMGGDVSLVAEIERNRAVQQALAQEAPEHLARAFGEHVEAASSSAGRAHVQQGVVQKACEMALPIVTRALADTFSQKIDDMVQKWQRQAMQQVDATLQDSIKLLSSKPCSLLPYAPRFAGDSPRVLGAPCRQREPQHPQPDGPRPHQFGSRRRAGCRAHPRRRTSGLALREAAVEEGLGVLPIHALCVYLFYPLLFTQAQSFGRATGGVRGPDRQGAATLYGSGQGADGGVLARGRVARAQGEVEAEGRGLAACGKPPAGRACRCSSRGRAAATDADRRVLRSWL